MALRTDLAAESAALRQAQLPQGVRQSEIQYENLHIHKVTVTTGEAAREIGKPQGDYTTITVPGFSGSLELSEGETELIAREIAAMLPGQGLVLVVGLGNNDITPDAIGPRTAHQILATRHISPQLASQSGLEGLQPVAALAPGVLGQTGIETSEVIQSVVARISPRAVVVVDALAARSTARLGNTIQIASSGISPGSGVMNARKELSRQTLGVPVVSIGIPTVVDAATLAADLLDPEDPDAKKALFSPEDRALMITPREIDVLIDHACKALAMAINKALQPQMTLEEIQYLAG